jgi:hypothetical protein
MTTTLGDTTTGTPAVEPATPRELLARIREQRAVLEAAEAELARLALEWADAHPDLDEPVETDPESDWFGLPNVRWDAAAPFAAANHMSSTAGRAMLRDLLLTRHRLPGLHARTVSGEVPVWRARRIATALLGQPPDVCTYLDQRVAHRAETVGPITLDRIIDEAKLRLHAEERELEQLEALDARFVRVYDGSINHTGIADLEARADWADLAAFDEAVAAVAAALGRDGCPESLDARRSIALGILADPERALALLAGTPQPSPKRRIVLTYDLTSAALLGIDPVGFDLDGRPRLDQLVRQWCGRDDVRLTIQPLLRVGGCAGDQEHQGHPVEDYRPSAHDELEVQLRDRTCVHPYCTRPARRCDCDHVIPHARGGPTCPCNLAPLCRHHHRLKTHAGWHYTILEPGFYLWSDPHGQHFLRGPHGTHDLTGQPGP